MFICNFCNEEFNYGAETETKSLICVVCWTYNLCVKAKHLAGEKFPFPCKDLNCGHKPILISKFMRYRLEKEEKKSSTQPFLDNLEKEEGRHNEE